MAMAVISWLIAIPILGGMTGLRTMTPIAVLCWFAYLGHLPVDGTWAFWAAKLPSAIIFTLFAIGELIGDKLPKTPNRTSPGPLAARLVFGGLVGALVATGLKGSAFEGIILGVINAALGAFLGMYLRKWIVDSTEWPDWRVAVAEDILAVVASIFAMGVVTG